jgi:AcrR family transcriptional regulator
MSPTIRSVNNSDRREVLRESTDARALRTRREIAEALQRLAQRKADVTVSSLVREAGVSRGTFYTHYAGLEELAGDLQATLVHHIAGWERQRAHLDPGEAVMSRRESIAEALRMVVDHYSEYRSFYAAVFSLPTSLETTNALVTALADELQEHMLTDAMIPPDVDARMAALFIAGGWMTVISEWVMGRLDAQEALVARHLVSLVPEWMYQLRHAAR